MCVRVRYVQSVFIEPGSLKVLNVYVLQESNNMVVPAMQLASKIPDMSVQLWSSALLKGEQFTLHLAFMAK